MKKKYLKTVEDLIALKDTNTKIYECSDKNSHYEFVNGCFCRFDGNGDIRFNDSILITNDIGYERYYILEEEPMQEATEEDLNKLCLFWDYGTDENAKKDEIHLLLEIKKNEKGRTEYWCDGCGESGFYHCRRATPSEVAEITGYKVEKK